VAEQRRRNDLQDAFRRLNEILPASNDRPSKKVILERGQSKDDLLVYHNPRAAPKSSLTLRGFSHSYRHHQRSSRQQFYPQRQALDLRWVLSRRVDTFRALSRLLVPATFANSHEFCLRAARSGRPGWLVIDVILDAISQPVSERYVAFVPALFFPSSESNVPDMRRRR
jgi:hypothetical protein